jgi:hypothetical protein
MKKLTTALVLFAMCFVSCKKEIKTETITEKDSDTVKTEQAEAEPVLDSAAQMKAWQAYATPGNPHKLMAGEVGT